MFYSKAAEWENGSDLIKSSGGPAAACPFRLPYSEISGVVAYHFEHSVQQSVKSTNYKALTKCKAVAR
jgi:hypothetical protein